jgi:HSP20 family molecular chaperone IbpA
MFAVLRPPRHHMLFDFDDDAESHSAFALRDFGRALGPFEPPSFAFAPGPSAMALGRGGGLHLVREGDKYVASCALPGVRRDDITLELHGNRVLAIRVQRGDAPGAPDQPDAAAPAAPAADHDSDQTTAQPDADKKDSAAQDNQPAAAAHTRQHFSAVLQRSVALPQLVDSAGIATTYRDGLLRVEIPIQPPAAGDEQSARMAALEQEAKDADARVEELCKQLTELRAKARDAHQAVRTEKAEAQRALQTSRHTLAIEAGA